MNGRHRDYVGVEVIGAFKLLKAVLLIVGAVLLPIVGKRHMEALFWLLRHLSVDPHAKYFQELVRKLIDLSPRFPLISVGMFCYAAIFSLEGIGLLLRRRWAEYLTVIVTASFLPLEIYEMIRHTTAVKGFVIALNVAILIYLIFRLKRGPKAGQHSPAKQGGILSGLRAGAR